MLPSVSHRAKVFQTVSIPRAIWTYGAHFGLNRSSRLAIFPSLLKFDPLKPKKMPSWYLEELIVLAYDIPWWISRHIPNLVPIGPVMLVDFLYFCIFDPLKHVFSEKNQVGPNGKNGNMVFYVHNTI